MRYKVCRKLAKGRLAEIPEAPPEFDELVAALQWIRLHGSITTMVPVPIPESRAEEKDIMRRERRIHGKRIKQAINRMVQ